MTTVRPPWTVPVRLLASRWLGLRWYASGATVQMPGWRAIYAERMGQVEILLPTIDIAREQMHDPLAPLRPPDQRRGMVW